MQNPLKVRWPWGSKASAPARAFVGAEVSRLARRLRGWKAERRHINALLAAGGADLRARSRQMSRENPYAANVIEAFVAAAVGTGIKPSSLIADAARRKAVQEAFLAWTDEADAAGVTDLYGLQALAARGMYEGGDVFVRMLDRPSSAGLTVPLQLQLLEAEMLPLEHNETLSTGHVIRQGIEFDANNNRVNYHFLKSHPGDLGRWRGIERVVVPAAEVLHLYRPLRPGQIRGVPGLAPAMVRLYLLDQYDEAELDRKRTAAMFAGFITKKSSDDLDPVSGQSPEEAGGDTAIAPLEPGLLQVLGEGEDVTFSEPADVGGAYEAFLYRNLCAIAVGAGIPYHLTSGDLSKANYGSQRGEQVSFRRRIEQYQHAGLVFQLCRPIWERWFKAAALVGAIPVPASEILRTPRVMAAKHIPNRWDWIDPKKDREAQAIAEDRGWVSRSDNIEAEGFDPEEVDARIAADRAREKAAGLDFSPQQKGAAPAAAPTSIPEDRTGFAA
jgi:lambda family phage portal protein